MDFNTCNKKNLVKQIKKDTGLIQSLLEESKKKLHTQEIIPLNNTTASSKISLFYDAIRELLEAIAIQNGYKIYNHECYCSFLKEIMKRSSLGTTFDTFRKLRNDLNYYGKSITAEEAKPILQSMHKLLEELKKIK